MSAKAKRNMSEYIQKEVVENMQYSVNIQCPKQYAYCEDGIIIDEHKTTDGNKIGTYYTVTTAFGWSIPFLNVLLRLNGEDGNTTSGNWTISGETRTIVNEAK